MNDEKEKRFLDALGALFTGARVEGDSGFINLMRVKNRYFEQIRPELMKKFNEAAPFGGEFREELFDKLYAFFSRYFCESGSVYFRRIPAFYPAREEVYADGGDMELVWKTRDLYYVKSDYLISSMPVEWTMSGSVFRFYFDASELETRQNNERRNFVFSFADVRKKKDADGREELCTVLRVSFSARGNKTNTDDILKKMCAAGAIVEAEEENLERAFAIFRRQTESDFFIHKNARAFLRGQFDMWMYQYIFREESDFGAARIAQLHGLRDCAHSLIDFIGQFEDELVRVWQKPKIARDVNYVLTADKLTAEVLQKAAAHSGAAAQVSEWRDLNLVGNDFAFADLLKNDSRKFLPLDTRHFKDLECEILECLGDLDSALDGEMIRGDNWQALNTLRGKYAGRIKCVYIDPPFNLDSSDQFDYRTNYKNANWATLLENRLTLARDFMAKDGSIFVRCDHNGNWIVRCLLDSVFGAENFKNEIALSRSGTPKGELTKMETGYDTMYFYAYNQESCGFSAPRIKREQREWQEMHLPSERTEDELRFRYFNGEKRYPPRGRHWALSQEAIDVRMTSGDLRINPDREYVDTEGNTVKGMPVSLQSEFKRVDANWTDITGYSSTMRNLVGIKFSTENSESLLARTVDSAAEKNEIIFDFFAGSGTTQAVAQKLGRKWLGAEMGAHFDTVILPRLKKVLAGHQSGISKETNYKGGGAFKYYALEQYEETLKKMRYKDADLLDTAPDKSPFEEYVFLADDKFAHAVSAGKGKNGKIKINLSALYADADLPETLANLIGSPLRRRTADTAEFANGETIKTNPAQMTEDEKLTLLQHLRPVLWWGE